MFAQNPPQRTYRNRNEPRQPSHPNMPNTYKRSNHAPQHYQYNNNNRATYSYTMESHPSTPLHLIQHLPPNIPHQHPHRTHPSHLHHNHHYIQNRAPYPRAHFGPHHHHHHPNHVHPNNAYHDHNNHKYAQKRKRNHHHKNHDNTAYHPRNRSGYEYNNPNQNYQQNASNPHQYHMHDTHTSHPAIPSDILICIDTVGPELIQYLPASTAYYLIEIIEPYLTNHTLHNNNNRVPVRRKSELLSKWHHSYAASKRMKAYLDRNDILNRLHHFNTIHTMNEALGSHLCVWDIRIKKCEIEQYFGTSRDLLIRSVLSYIIMECFLRNKHNVWFHEDIIIEKELNIGDIHRFLVSKLQKIDDIKKFYSKSMHPKIEDNAYLLCLLNEFKSRFERDNFGGDTLLYCHSWMSHKFEHILSNLATRYPVYKNRKKVKKSAIYELGFRSRLDRPIFGFYIGTHKGYNPRTKGIELKFNPSNNYSFFKHLKWLFLPEFIEDEVLNYFSFDVKWESDYTRGEHFKYFNLICADVNCSNDEDPSAKYQRFKFVVWKGQYFDADDNLLGQYSG
eukprot:162289_1